MDDHHHVDTSQTPITIISYILILPVDIHGVGAGVVGLVAFVGDLVGTLVGTFVGLGVTDWTPTCATVHFCFDHLNNVGGLAASAFAFLDLGIRILP